MTEEQLREAIVKIANESIRRPTDSGYGQVDLLVALSKKYAINLAVSELEKIRDVSWEARQEVDQQITKLKRGKE